MGSSYYKDESSMTQCRDASAITTHSPFAFYPMDEKTDKEIQDEYWNELEDYITKLAEELNCSKVCATDVWYLRQRSRWTQELENELIAKYAAGEAVNICEFGH